MEANHKEPTNNPRQKVRIELVDQKGFVGLRISVENEELLDNLLEALSEESGLLIAELEEIFKGDEVHDLLLEISEGETVIREDPEAVVLLSQSVQPYLEEILGAVDCEVEVVIPDSPQLEHGYTRIVNRLLEDWAKSPLFCHRSRVNYAIVRETYGYAGKKETKEEARRPITNEKLMELTGLDERSIRRAIHDLLNANMIEREKTKIRTRGGFQTAYKYLPQKVALLWINPLKGGTNITPPFSKALKTNVKPASPKQSEDREAQRGGQIVVKGEDKYDLPNQRKSLPAKAQPTTKKSIKERVVREDEKPSSTTPSLSKEKAKGSAGSKGNGGDPRVKKVIDHFRTKFWKEANQFLMLTRKEWAMWSKLVKAVLVSEEDSRGFSLEEMKLKVDAFFKDPYAKEKGYPFNLFINRGQLMGWAGREVAETREARIIERKVEKNLIKALEKNGPMYVDLCVLQRWDWAKSEHSLRYSKGLSEDEDRVWEKGVSTVLRKLEKRGITRVRKDLMLVENPGWDSRLWDLSEEEIQARGLTRDPEQEKRKFEELELAWAKIEYFEHFDGDYKDWECLSPKLKRAWRGYDTLSEDQQEELRRESDEAIPMERKQEIKAEQERREAEGEIYEAKIAKLKLKARSEKAIEEAKARRERGEGYDIKPCHLEEEWGEEWEEDDSESF